MIPNQAELASRFAALHAGAPFVIPNPWDAGSARVLEALGFPALATTSSGFAFTLGRRDGDVTLDEVAAHVESLAGASTCRSRSTSRTATAPSPRTPPRAIDRVAEAGAVGGSIEDWDPGGHLYELAHAVERVAAAAEAARGSVCRSCSPRGPRTTSAAIPTSTTRSRGSRRTRRRAPTSSTRRASRRPRDPRRLRGGVEAGQRPRAARSLDGRDRRGGRPADQRRRRAGLDRGRMRSPRRRRRSPSEATTRRWATAQDSPTGSSRSRPASASSDPERPST